MGHTMLQWLKCHGNFWSSFTSYNRCTRNEEFADCADYKHWSTNPRTVREAFRDDSQSTLKFDNDSSSFSHKDDLLEPLCHDKDQILLKLKNRLKPFISDEELCTLLDSKYYTNENTGKNNESSFCPSNDMNNDCIIANEEDCNSLFNDTDKVIQGLTNRLKDFISCDEINKLLIINTCESNDVDNSCEISGKSSTTSYIFNCIKSSALYVLSSLFKRDCPYKLSSAVKQIDECMDNPEMPCTQQKSQCQTHEEYSCGDDQKAIAQVDSPEIPCTQQKSQCQTHEEYSCGDDQMVIAQVDSPEIPRTQQKSQCQTHEEYSCGDDQKAIAQMDNPEIPCTQQQSQCQTHEEYSCEDDQMVQAWCTCDQQSYCLENARLKKLLNTTIKKFKRRENYLQQLVFDLRKLHGKLIKDPCY